MACCKKDTRVPRHNGLSRPTSSFLSLPRDTLLFVVCALKWRTQHRVQNSHIISRHTQAHVSDPQRNVLYISCLIVSHVCCMFNFFVRCGKNRGYALHYRERTPSTNSVYGKSFRTFVSKFPTAERKLLPLSLSRSQAANLLLPMRAALTRRMGATRTFLPTRTTCAGIAFPLCAHPQKTCEHASSRRRRKYVPHATRAYSQRRRYHILPTALNDKSFRK